MIIEVDFKLGARLPGLPGPVEAFIEAENPLRRMGQQLQVIAYRVEDGAAHDIVFFDDYGISWAQSRRKDGTVRVTDHSQRVNAVLKRCAYRLTP